MKNILNKLFLTMCVAVISVTSFTTLVPPEESSAAILDKFNAENIIGDGVFTHNKSMTTAQIQSFLNSKNSKCLKDYKTLGLYDSNNDGLGDEPYGKGKNVKVSAATLIKQAADMYNINPKVILVTLQKEQGLITRQDCPAWRYNTALGYGCPDHEPCDNTAYGFTRQIDYGTWHFRGFYLDTFPVPPTVPGKKFIAYNPTASCGGKTINIRNRATAALYSYTPYQPNKAALDAGLGEAPCGAYGNRNFFYYFTAWFGSTQAIQFKPMKTPRSMQAIEDINKTSANTLKVDGALVKKDHITAYDTATNIYGETYVRSVGDTKNKSPYAVPLSSLRNAPAIPYKNLRAPITFKASKALKKTELYSLQNIGASIEKGQKVEFNSYAIIDGMRYYRTQLDTKRGSDFGVPANNLRAVFKIGSMKKPRQLQLRSSQSKTSLHTTLEDGTKMSKGQVASFSKSTTIGGEMYLLTNHDAREGIMYGIPYSSLKTVPTFKFSSMKYPRKMKSTEKLAKTSLYTMKQDGTNISKGLVMSFKSTIVLDGVRYLRTAHDTKLGIAYVIPYSQLRNV